MIFINRFKINAAIIILSILLFAFWGVIISDAPPKTGVDLVESLITEESLDQLPYQFEYNQEQVKHEFSTYLFSHINAVSQYFVIHKSNAHFS